MSDVRAQHDARPQGVQTFDQPLEGARSPRNANYEIDVRLDHANRTLHGRETIRWRNISNRATSELQFHLYWNAWRDEQSTWMRERRLAGNRARPRADAWGSSEVTRIALAESPGHLRDLTRHQRFIAPDDGNADDRTVMAVSLPREVAPLETVEVALEWRARIPRTFARTGYINEYYFIAQWFPKVGVLQDDGWNTHQFHAATEFYSDYGSYDVRLTVPRRFVVGASGREVTRTENAGGTVTFRYREDDIHDFAWTASPRFLDVRKTFEHPTLPRTEMRLLLQPEHAGQEERHFAATAVALKYYGEWFGAYPYGHITIIDPAYQSGSGGMEYPTLFTAGSRWLAPRDVTQPESVTVHEAGHQFWYGVVGSNEFERAWMDEGFNTFSTARAMAEAMAPNFQAVRYFDGFVPWVIRDIPLTRIDNDRLAGYRASAEADAQSTPTFRYWPGTASAMSYNKTALWMHTLERHLGWPVLQRILSTYFDRWKFRHPQPEHFFAAVNEGSGRDMTWFFDQVYRSSNVFDYGVQEFASERSGNRFRTTVVARRFGEATFPVDVVTTFEDGKQAQERWDGVERRAAFTYDRPTRAVSVEIDPQRVLLLDVNYTNNSRTLQPRGREAGLKWALAWMAWLQQVMLTYAFFV
jgi:aminopeptidase N